MWIIFPFMFCAIVFLVVRVAKAPSPRNSDPESNRYCSRHIGNMIQVDLRFFTSKYRVAIPFDDFLKYQDMMLRGIYTITLPQEHVENIKNRYMNNKEKEALLFRTAELNNKGLELEKQGDIDGAIAIYEDNIKGGYKATRSYDRLMILYRKAKAYDDEIRVINKALEVFSDDPVLVDQYQYRLNRANYYKSKVK